MLCTMSFKVYFLDFQRDIFPKNLGSVSDEHGKRFQQVISSPEKRYQCKWSPSMVADYFWAVHYQMKISLLPLSNRPERPWGRPSFLDNGYRVFPGAGAGAGAEALTTHPI